MSFDTHFFCVRSFFGDCASFEFQVDVAGVRGTKTKTSLNLKRWIALRWHVGENRFSGAEGKTKTTQFTYLHFVILNLIKMAMRCLRNKHSEVPLLSLQHSHMTLNVNLFILLFRHKTQKAVIAGREKKILNYITRNSNKTEMFSALRLYKKCIRFHAHVL